MPSESLTEKYATAFIKRKLADVGHRGNVLVDITIVPKSALRTKLHGTVNVVGIIEFDYWVEVYGAFHTTSVTASYLDIYNDHAERYHNFDITRLNAACGSPEEVFAYAVGELAGFVVKKELYLT